MNAIPRGSTRVVGLLGGEEQVQQSLSPAIHNAAFEALDLDWIYVPFPVRRPGHLEESLRGLQASGVRGVNVTMPYKVDAAFLMNRVEGAAATIEAVNTIDMSSEAMVGWNTDGEGLVRFLRRDVGVSIEGSSVLVFGSGGAARAAVAALSDSGANSITVVVRGEGSGEELERLATGSKFMEVELDTDEALEAATAANLIVNATPIGQHGEDSPVPPEAIARGCVVVDLVYRPPSTPLIEAALARGAIAHNGLGMLLHQAALSFEIWTGVEPPLEKMSAAALSALKRQ